MAWHSARELLTAGGDALFRWTKLDESLLGRSANVVLSTYFCFGMNYYSHEIAHRFYNKNKRHFWVDIYDWSHGVPKYVEHSWRDIWNVDEFEYYRTHPPDPYIINQYLLGAEAGLYQNRYNSWFIARIATLNGSTNLTDGIAFCTNASREFLYIYEYANDKMGIIKKGDFEFLDCNDTNGYIYWMDELGIEISKDTWLAASGLSVLLSGQFWNSLYSVYSYLARGDACGNLEFDLGEGISIAPPNFYLFPTVRGLYLESETSLRGFWGPMDLTFFSFGSGLDLLGINKAGSVNRVRVGSRYHPARMLHFFRISPFVYLDFEGDTMKQIGHSVGLALETKPGKRFFLAASLEHNRRDMLEQTIKSKDEGLYFIAALGFRM